MYVAEHSRANIMIVEDQEQFAKIEAIWEKLPDLQSVVNYAGSPSSLEVKSWQGLLDIGREENS